MTLNSKSSKKFAYTKMASQIDKLVTKEELRNMDLSLCRSCITNMKLMKLLDYHKGNT